MITEDIIEGLNKHIEERRTSLNIKASGHLVIQRAIVPNTTFKAYKEYTATLWFVKGKKKYEVLQYKENIKMIEGQEDVVMRKINASLCRSIFSWIGSEHYNNVITGIYGRYSNE